MLLTLSSSLFALTSDTSAMAADTTVARRVRVPGLYPQTAREVVDILCMYVFIYMYIRACMEVVDTVCVCVCVCVCTAWRPEVCACLDCNPRQLVREVVDILDVCFCACFCICVYACMYVCTYIHICTHLVSKRL